jgi:hypothetical protein
MKKCKHEFQVKENEFRSIKKFHVVNGERVNYVLSKEELRLKARIG